jgi:cytochrome b pre-mRNA-processing protein 3
MIRALFAGLTGGPKRGQPLFQMAVAEARRPHWFREGQVPDTVEGRFAVLATVVALTIVRLESGGREGEKATIAITERLVEALDTEIREMGVGDPALGKQVRHLIGALGGRVERWRAILGAEEDWTAEVRRSLYRDRPADPQAIAYARSQLADLWRRLEATSVEDLVEGRIG